MNAELQTSMPALALVKPWPEFFLEVDEIGAGDTPALPRPRAKIYLEAPGTNQMLWLEAISPDGYLGKLRLWFAFGIN